MTLTPGEFVYVVKDAVAFGHPELTVAGEYSGELDDDGERLRLELSFGAGVVDVTYADGVAVGTDGGGNSLELVADGGLKGGQWTASAITGGTFDELSAFEDYATWQNAMFTPAEVADELVSGVGADPDLDGLVNLLEQLFGRDPKLADADGMPEPSLEGDEVVIRYRRSVSAAGELVLAMSGDLAAWSRDVPGLVAEVVSQEGGRQIIELRIPVGAAARQFFRMEGSQ